MDLAKLKGKKTYVMVIATICYALGGAVSGHLDWGVAVGLIIGSLGLGALRDAFPKPEVKTEVPDSESHDE